MRKIIRLIFSFLVKWFWDKPTQIEKPKAVDVEKNYKCIKYKGIWINLRLNEIAQFNALSRKDKRAMAKRFEILEKKGKIKFVEINGKAICVKNKDYAN